MKKFSLMGLAALAVSGAFGITATKEYVDRQDAAIVTNIVESTNAVLLAANAETTAATNATLVASKAYTDAAIEGAGGVTPQMVGIIATNTVDDKVASWAMKGQPQPSGSVTDVKTNGVSALSGSVANINLDYLPITGGKILHDGQLVFDDNTNMFNCIKVRQYSGNPPSRVEITYSLGDWISQRWWMMGRSYNLADWNITNAYTKAECDNANSNTLAIVNSWENFLDGSNVVFSITNYISGAYILDEAKLKILELKTNEYHEVYNSRDEILLHLNDFETNKLIAATNALVTGPIAAVNTKVDGKADKAWGQYTSAGGVAPSNTVYMTAPSTVFAGGLEYERVAVGEGMVGILTTKGAPVYTAGDEGTFKFQDDGGTNYFGFSKTDSYTLGCNTDGISVNNHLVTLTYNVTMSGVPCIWYCSTLDVQPLVWEQLNTPDGQPIAGASHTVSWETTPAAGTEVCYINCPEAKGFFKATVEVAGSAKFMTNMPADLSGGIMCTNTAINAIGIIRPSYNGSTVTWTWSTL